MKMTVSEKGQVTIPKKLRDRLGIRPGQVLEIVEENGCLIARRIIPEDPLESVYGLLSGAGRTETWLEALRGGADAVDPE